VRADDPVIALPLLFNESPVVASSVGFRRSGWFNALRCSGGGD
jgi:hypothetical protein